MLTRLTGAPVAGVIMDGVTLLRLDLAGGLAPGNKYFKLAGNLAEARDRRISRLVSFGGAWSNHLHALAAIGYEQGFDTVGIVRGDEDTEESAMLADARDWGMQIEKMSRSEYRRRNQPAFLEQLATQFAPCLIIPEGGANPAGVHGCMEIAKLVSALAPGPRRILVPVGTGTTLAGLVAGLDSDCEVIGVSALKGAADLEARVDAALAGYPAESRARWRILHHEHCGGFARISPALRDFMLEFERVQSIALEPVYTGKMLFAIHRHLAAGVWEPDIPLLAIHTGGLQGRRGFNWLPS